MVLCGAVVIGLLSVLFSGMCGNEVQKEYLSPNGGLKAVVFQRSCGATTGFSTQISMLNSRATLSNKAGNVFITDWATGRESLTVTWLSDSELEIKKHPNLAVYKSEEAWGSWFRKTVRVKYK